jgi:hypothetical protein
MAEEGNGKIKWKDMIAMCTISVSVCLGALTFHSQTPHEDAISNSVFSIFSKNIDHKFDSVDKKLDKLETKIDALNDNFLKNGISDKSLH